ncbi:MAG: hypothetical protein WCO08_00615 [Actinomycetes bacterium]
MSDLYQPGVCNIGPQEIRRRRLVGYFGLLITIATAFLLQQHHSSRITRFSIFFPAMVFSFGWIQAKKKFCMGFGLAGTFNFGKLGNLDRIEMEVFRKQDRDTVIKMALQAIAVALVITALELMLPL